MLPDAVWSTLKTSEKKPLFSASTVNWLAPRPTIVMGFEISSSPLLRLIVWPARLLAN